MNGANNNAALVAQAPTSEVIIETYNNEAVVSSREIAERFEKRHDHVIRDIETLLGGVPKIGETPSESQKSRLNEMFHWTEYVHPQNGQSYPMYLMNRDGFGLLVMGFTGKKALEWKLKYIEAFNKMEATLRGQYNLETLSALTTQVNTLQAQVESLTHSLIDIRKKNQDDMENVMFYVKGNQNRLDEIKVKIQNQPQQPQAYRTVRSYDPHPNQEVQARSVWRQNVYELVHQYAKLEALPQSAIYKRVYDNMNRVYGWYFKDARDQYIEKTGYKGDISKISGLDVIEDSEMYRSIFLAILKDLLATAREEAKVFGEKKNATRLSNGKPPLIPIELIPKSSPKTAEEKAAMAAELADDYSPKHTDIIEVSVKEVNETCMPEKKTRSNGYKPSALVAIVEPVAKRLGDKTLHYYQTYGKVYDIIGMKKMNRMTNKYTKDYGRPPRSKAILFMSSDKNMKAFKDAVKQLESEI